MRSPRMRKRLQEFLSQFDLQDCMIVGGLLCLAAGLALIAVPLGLIAVGVLLFLLGIGHFAQAPRRSKGGPD